MANSLDPQIEGILKLVEDAGHPEFWELTPEQARAAFEKTAPILDARPVEIFNVENIKIPAPSGSTNVGIPLRIYVPVESQQALPVLLWIHGGGFVVGGLDSYDSICRQLAKRTECIVVSVDYRLAPDHKFPAAVEDCFAALQWVMQHATACGGDPTRIAIGGDSAGGNLSAVTAILARDAGLAKNILLQLLIYPCTAAKPDTDSHYQYAEGYLLTRKNMLWFIDNYLNDESDTQDFRYAPLITEDLSNLPPALVIVADHDPLYDEGVAYAGRLRAAGNQVELSDYQGAIHGFYSMSGAADIAKQALKESAAALSKAFSVS